MFKIDAITKDWKEAGAFMAQVNLYGFWDEHSFLTKSGDLGCTLKIGGIDAEGLDHAGRDYVVKRLKAALRSLDEKTRLYQVLFRHNRRCLRRFEYGKMFALKVRIPVGAAIDAKEERQVGEVGIERPLLS